MLFLHHKRCIHLHSIYDQCFLSHHSGYIYMYYSICDQCFWSLHSGYIYSRPTYGCMLGSFWSSSSLHSVYHNTPILASCTSEVGYPVTAG